MWRVWRRAVLVGLEIQIHGWDITRKRLAGRGPVGPGQPQNVYHVGATYDHGRVRLWDLAQTKSLGHHMEYGGAQCDDCLWRGGQVCLVWGW